MSKITKEEGDFTLFELNSTLDKPENLNLIKNYLFENGYEVTFSNSDMYRLMYLTKRIS